MRIISAFSYRNWRHLSELAGGTAFRFRRRNGSNNLVESELYMVNCVDGVDRPCVSDPYTIPITTLTNGHISYVSGDREVAVVEARVLIGDPECPH